MLVRLYAGIVCDGVFYLLLESYVNVLGKNFIFRYFIFFIHHFEVLWVVAEIIVAFTIEPTFNSKYRIFHIV